jgi:hypothetical protein
VPVPFAIREAIFTRGFWLHLSNPHLSREEARSLAVEQIAQEEREKARHQRQRRQSAQPRTSKDGATDFGALLLARMMSMLANIERRRSRATEVPTPAPPVVDAVEPVAPEPTPTPTLGQRITGTLHDLAARVGIEAQPEPEPTRPQPPLIRAEGSSAVLIDEEREMPHLVDQTTRNWRASIRRNEAIQREQRRRPSSFIIG